MKIENTEIVELLTEAICHIDNDTEVNGNYLIFYSLNGHTYTINTETKTIIRHGEVDDA